MSVARRHVTLFVPGLSQPPVTVEAQQWSGLVQLTCLERLLARGDVVDPPSRNGNPEGPLFRLCGFSLEPGCDPPVAAVTHRLDMGDQDDGWYMRVDPVHLRPDLDKLLLFDAQTFVLSEDEAHALASELRELLGRMGGELFVPVPSRWYLRLPEPPGIRTHSLVEVSGHDLRACLPEGDRAAEWRSLLNEIQMVLHVSPVNRAREERGEPAVNSVWFWGGGPLPAPGDRLFDQIWSDDPLARGLAQLAGAAAPGRPADGEAWQRSAELGVAHLVVLDELQASVRYRDMAVWLEQLEKVETRWLSPLWDGLRRGQLASLTLVDNGRLGRRATRRSTARWWRRTRPFREYFAGD